MALTIKAPAGPRLRHNLLQAASPHELDKAVAALSEEDARAALVATVELALLNLIGEDAYAEWIGS